MTPGSKKIPQDIINTKATLYGVTVLCLPFPVWSLKGITHHCAMLYKIASNICMTKTDFFFSKCTTCYYVIGGYIVAVSLRSLPSHVLHTFLSNATKDGMNSTGAGLVGFPYVRVGLVLASSSRSASVSWFICSCSPPIIAWGRFGIA